MKKSLQSLFFILIGLVLGTGLGLFIGWVAWPIEFSDASLAVLQSEYQADYVQMVADVYAHDQDLGSATRRLESLGLNYQTFVLDTLNNQLLGERDLAKLQRLAQLANDLGLSSPAIAPLLAPGGTP